VSEGWCCWRRRRLRRVPACVSHVAGARQIYLEKPHGAKGFWTRLPGLEAPSLFVRGKHDGLVPIKFKAHVRSTLPSARHVELDCGHVRQIERPAETHAAIAAFLQCDGRLGERCPGNGEPS
jgi:pimeloyl-ACP methyl ester carboxylesterase